MWRGDENARRAGIASNERLRPVVDELVRAGYDVVPVVYRDAVVEEVRAELAGVDAVLVWVDPIGGGEDRHRLDALLRDLSAGGTFVSAHPDVINVLGTKDVLFATRHLRWGGDVARYDTIDELREGLRARLPAGPRVLKPRYGNGGIGVWKVERVDDATVRAHGAEVRDLHEEVVSFDAFVDRFNDALAAGCVVDQGFVPGVSEGLIRCYFVGTEVVGFAEQGAGELAAHPDRVMGLPSPKTVFAADAAQFDTLRQLVTTELPALLGCLGLDAAQLPVLWDADFLRGDGGYVLCEVNCSCVTPFPPLAPAKIASMLEIDRRSRTA